MGGLVYVRRCLYGRDLLNDMVQRDFSQFLGRRSNKQADQEPG